ncbi:hypothetical protein [Hymenobacter daecheongensis]|uniref:hypothetical protein n=1 Tax=Hymenobacter daecheongensis TaxID=496053 RepID=UPI00093534CD|nr:hypothetical protein [Hymenobacter daecheongensis]
MLPLIGDQHLYVGPTPALVIEAVWDSQVLRFIYQWSTAPDASPEIDRHQQAERIYQDLSRSRQEAEVLLKGLYRATGQWLTVGDGLSLQDSTMRPRVVYRDFFAKSQQPQAFGLLYHLTCDCETLLNTYTKAAL